MSTAVLAPPAVVSTAGLTAAIDVLDAAVGSVGGAAALEVVAALVVAQRRLDAIRLRLLAVAEQAQTARDRGALSTATWLRGRGERPGAANRDVQLAGTLAAHQAVATAMGQGRISADHARVITDATAQLPLQVRSAAEARLVDAATRLDPGELAKEAIRVLTRLHPDGPARLERAEQAAKAGRELVVARRRDGSGYDLLGRLDGEAAATLDAALTPLAAPLPADDGTPDPRSPARRRADALVELCRRALAGAQLPASGGLRPTVVVTMTLDQLRGQPDCAELAAGTLTEPISAAAARRWACDAAIIPAVLGADGALLDLGRARRTASPAQRRALTVRDRGCAFPGCHRPPAWTDAHHIRWWRHGPTTDLDNLVLLCARHHDQVHHHGWTITPQPGRSPTFHPPDRR